MSVTQAQTVHISIQKPWREVYAFASRHDNMPQWAAGLANGLEPDGESWIADGGPLGTVRVDFVPENDLGVIDHVVTMPNGLKVYNALRVTPNGDGAEVTFTLPRLDGMSDADFERDAELVHKDLATLKALLESA